MTFLNCITSSKTLIFCSKILAECLILLAHTAIHNSFLLLNVTCKTWYFWGNPTPICKTVGVLHGKVLHDYTCMNIDILTQSSLWCTGTWLLLQISVSHAHIISTMFESDKWSFAFLMWVLLGNHIVWVLAADPSPQSWVHSDSAACSCLTHW